MVVYVWMQDSLNYSKLIEFTGWRIRTWVQENGLTILINWPNSRYMFWMLNLFYFLQSFYGPPNILLHLGRKLGLLLKMAQWVQPHTKQIGVEEGAEPKTNIKSLLQSFSRHPQDEYALRQNYKYFYTHQIVINLT